MANDNTMNAYIYGSISIGIVSLLSLVGAVIIPCLKTNSRQRWMQVFIALAVATLACDAFMHLIPQALGVHNHDHGDHEEHSSSELKPTNIGSPPFADNLQRRPTSESGHEHEHGDHEHDHDHRRKRSSANRVKRQEDHDHENEDSHSGENQWEEKKILIRMSVVLASVYLFYIFETVAHGISDSRKQSHLKNKINSAVYQTPGVAWDHRSNLPNVVYPEASKLGQSSGAAYINGGVPTHLASQWRAQHVQHYAQNEQMTVAETQMYATPSTTSNSSRELVPSASSSSVSNEESHLCLGFKPIAFMILMGDAIHNFADGLAVGAAFAFSTKSGFATSVAIAFHELPHEIGDFAILIDSGLSICKALLLNLLSSITAFIGLYIGIAVSQQEEARMWIFALAAGMFIYVALVDMLPHLKQIDSTDPFYVQLALQNLGFIIGFVIMFLIGWFEHDIKI